MKFFSLCCVSLLLVFPLIAQDGKRPYTLNVHVDLVELHVSVMDDKDRSVGGLGKDHFRVFEKGIEQPISVFKHEDIPVSLGLVVDNSRSMEPRKQRVDAAALSFVQQSNPDDETFVVHFDSDVRLDQHFTTSLSDLQQTLAGTKPFGQTAIYDALMVAINEMDKAKYDKKALLLITDGEDNSSKATIDEVIEALRRSHISVFSVGLLSDSGGLKAEESLIRVADASGGRAYFPETVDQARQMMAKIARDLREQYTLGYFPTDPARDGGWRSVRVDINPPSGFPKKLSATYRHGYYAGS
jgi:VWFA-related protein